MADLSREIRTLQHYFRTVFRAAGLKWDEDNDAEIHILVEGVAEAARGAAPAPPPSSAPTKPVVVRRNGRSYSLPEQSAKNREDLRRLHAEGMSDTEIAAALPHLARSTVKELRKDLGLEPNVKKFAGHACCGAKGQRHKKGCGGQPLPVDLKEVGVTVDAVGAGAALSLINEATADAILADSGIAGLTWKCTECGSRKTTDDGKPEKCAECGNTALVQVP